MAILFDFKKCDKCQRRFPEFLFQEYSRLAIRTVCPICARDILNRLSGKELDTPFPNEDDQDLWNEAKEFLKTIKYNVPGAMINPPEDCQYRKRYPGSWGNEDGGVWVELGICEGGFKICKKFRTCERYQQFKRMTIDEIYLELWNNGVVIT